MDDGYVVFKAEDLHLPHEDDRDWIIEIHPDGDDRLVEVPKNDDSVTYLRHNIRNEQWPEREALWEFWRHPDEDNAPETYLCDAARRQSERLVELVRRYAGPGARILEIGSNLGRNLHYLYEAGYRNLEAVEINADAVAMFRRLFPEAAGATTVHVAPVEQAIRDFPDGAFDVVFTMATLEHLHVDSAWVFAEMVRILQGTLVTVEDEWGVSWRHFPRNYKRVFEPLGLAQVWREKCNRERYGLPGDFVARVFRKGDEEEN